MKFTRLELTDEGREGTSEPEERTMTRRSTTLVLLQLREVRKDKHVLETIDEQDRQIVHTLSHMSQRLLEVFAIRV